jgi:hypothetical protein
MTTEQNQGLESETNRLNAKNKFCYWTITSERELQTLAVDSQALGIRKRIESSEILDFKMCVRPVAHEKVVGLLETPDLISLASVALSS